MTKERIGGGMQQKRQIIVSREQKDKNLWEISTRFDVDKLIKKYG
jgi:hypothetical protein